MGKKKPQQQQILEGTIIQQNEKKKWNKFQENLILYDHLIYIKYPTNWFLLEKRKILKPYYSLTKVT